jgi:hypothetical protein
MLQKSCLEEDGMELTSDVIVLADTAETFPSQTLLF